MTHALRLFFVLIYFVFLIICQVGTLSIIFSLILSADDSWLLESVAFSIMVGSYISETTELTLTHRPVGLLCQSLKHLCRHSHVATFC